MGITFGLLELVLDLILGITFNPPTGVNFAGVHFLTLIDAQGTVESAPSADDGSRPPPPQNEQQAPMGRGGGSAETRRPQRGRKRAVSGDLGEEDQRESISRRLPDEGRGQKRSPDGEGDASDARGNVSRRLPDGSGQASPSGSPQQYGPDLAGVVEKKAVKWNTKVEDFESKAAWGRARRDMAVRHE